MQNVSELRKQHLLTRASAMNLENRNQDSKTIRNIQRIKQTIKMWRTINYLTHHTKSLSLQTINIPEDSFIQWNEIKKYKGIQFQTITDPEQTDTCITEGNTHHLNQTQGSAFTIEPLKSLIGEDGFTSFANVILKGIGDFSHLKLSPTIKTYPLQLKRSKEIISNAKIQ